MTDGNVGVHEMDDDERTGGIESTPADVGRYVNFALDSQAGDLPAPRVLCASARRQACDPPSSMLSGRSFAACIDNDR